MSASTIAVDDGAPADAPARADGWAYRPHLDGLRALAVYLVVAFHAGVGRLSGGFIGVDVFFVLSGYLVTGVLLRDAEGDEGRVRFGRFYARRVRRLLPAAAVNLVVTALVFRSIAEPALFDAGWRGIRSAALYVSNWFFIRESADYFGSEIEQSPVAHYWSLSVEEQFYLVWPVLFAGLAVLVRRLGPRGRSIRWGLVAAAAVASLVAALLLTSADDPNRAYYGTDTRAYQLLAGALVAFSPGALARLRSSRAAGVLPYVTLASIAGLLVAATNQISMGPVERGVVAMVFTVAVLVSLEASDGGPARWLLSRRPLVHLGAISYGTYLWHWLVILVLARTWELSNVGTALVTAAVASGLAALSYELLEQPIRRSGSLERMRPAVIGVGLVLSLLIGLVAAPRLLDESSAGHDVEAVQGDARGTPNTVDWQAAKADRYGYERCTPSSAEPCRLTSGPGPKVLVVGESHAAMWLPMLEEIAAEHGWNLYGGLLDYCPWPYGVKYAFAGKNCLRDQEHLYETIVPALDPDIVILGHRPIDDPQNSIGVADAEGGIGDAKKAAAALDAAVRRSVDSLRAPGRSVVLIEPTPAASEEANPLTCLSRAKFLEACRFVASPGPLDEEVLYRALEEEHPGQVVSLDLDPVVCPYLPICDPIVRGKVVKWDATHLTNGFTISVADLFQLALDLKGVELAG